MKPATASLLVSTPRGLGFLDQRNELHKADRSVEVLNERDLFVPQPIALATDEEVACFYESRRFYHDDMKRFYATAKFGG